MHRIRPLHTLWTRAGTSAFARPVLATLLAPTPFALTLFALTLLVLPLLVPDAHAQERRPDVVPEAKMAKAASTADVVQALGLQPADVASVSFGSSSGAGFGVFPTAAAGFPRKDTTFLVLSSGAVSSAFTANTSGSTSTTLSGLNTPGGGNDMVQMVLELNVPTGATKVSFDFKFLSEEFPEFVGSAFNDGFVVEKGASTFTVSGANVAAPGNLVFDQNGNAITINTTGPLGMSAGNASGTTYDGATPVLTTEVPLTPSDTTVTLIFSVFDVGDNIYDSTVFLDDVRFDTQILELTGLEVNQSVQSWENGVRLVEDKPATVRAFIQNDNPTGAGTGQNVNVRLAAERGGSALSGSPLTAANNGSFALPANTTNATTIENRRKNATQSLNFELPPGWREGTVTFTLEADSLDCAPAAATNADCEFTVEFESVAEPEIKWVRVRWRNASTSTVNVPSLTDVNAIENDVVAMLPFSGFDRDDGFLALSDTTAPTSASVLSKIKNYRFRDGCWLGCDRIYHGISENIDGAGRAEIGGTAAISDRIQGRATTPAHETGHIFDRSHAVNQTNLIPPGREGPCGSSASLFAPTFPYTDATTAYISPVGAAQDQQIWGLDTRATSVKSPDSHTELMSYCSSPRWNSDFTYEGILDDAISRFGTSKAGGPILASRQAALAPAPLATPTRYLVVRGILNLATTTVEWEPFSTITTDRTPPVPPPGDYTLLLLDADGAVVTQVAFEPDVTAGDGGEDDEPVAFFLIPVEYDPAIVEARVVFDDAVIGTRTASANAPDVEVVFPNGGESLSGDAVTIRWSSTDADGDALTHLVQFSPDGGETWETLAVDYVGTETDVPLSALGETSQGLIRVQASDGFNASQDVSDGTFITPNSEPTGSILKPGEGRVFIGNEPIFFAGTGADSEDGSLSGPSLQWSSNRDGFLGAGDELSVSAADLTVGVHVITLTVIDGQGATFETTVTIEVKKDGGTVIAAPTCAELDVAALSFRITDFDADQGDPDTAEFVEVTNQGSDDVSLTGCSMVFFDGATSLSYFATNLGGTVDAGSSFRIGNTGAGNVGQVFPDDTLQDGPDAIAVYKAPATDFPDGVGTDVNLDVLLTSVVYVSDDEIFGSKTQPRVQYGPEALQRLREISAKAAKEAVPKTFALEQSYPNPSTASATIRFALPEDADVRMELYDLLGRRVALLMDGPMRAGYHTYVLNGTSLASGTYFYRLQAGDRVATRSMRVVR